jgi:ATP-dependent DNA ligase
MGQRGAVKAARYRQQSPSINSIYEPGQRSGAWLKMRVNHGQEFVIGGYTRGTKSFDALVFGVYEGDKLIYVARTRNGFTPIPSAWLCRARTLAPVRVRSARAARPTD